ncbi:MAG TPA: amidase [Gammaproteobacteria bacterium]|nr:amidase [Gammaproteobacteria bacterium]
MSDLIRLTATEAAARIAVGDISSESLVQSCLDHIELRDGQVRAWHFLDTDAAIREAQARDSQDPIGPLHGVPVGIKDVIDTRRMPTGYGSPIFAGLHSVEEAKCISLLEHAGAIILGKTVTAEFATYKPGPTTNPLAREHTPGGSSSGSAAAVADYQVPLALGTQTAGSVIRPASYCGIIGFKPTKPRYDDTGVIETSPNLDTLGTFARSVEDIALLDSVLGPVDAKPIEAVDSPLIGICRTSVWGEASPDMQRTLALTAEALQAVGARVVDVQLPSLFSGLPEAQRKIHTREAYQALGSIWREHPNDVSDALVAMLTTGMEMSEEAYESALDLQRQCQRNITIAFGSVDCLLTPGATGSAPHGLHMTGDPAFNRIWTALGTPCLGFPAATISGLPLGLQLVGRPSDDSSLLAISEWAVKHISHRV